MKAQRRPQRSRYAKYTHMENVHLQSAYDDASDLRDRITSLRGQLNTAHNLAAALFTQGIQVTHLVALNDTKRLAAVA